MDFFCTISLETKLVKDKPVVEQRSGFTAWFCNDNNNMRNGQL